MRKRWQCAFFALGLATALGLAGCGASSSAANGTPATTITPTRAMNGCPSQLIPVDGAPHADVLVTGQNDAPNQSVKLRVDKSIEVRLSAGIIWHLATTDATGVLSASAPQGWFDSGHLACVWVFTANTAGQATLMFSGGLLCAPDVACPTIAAAQTYTVQVQ